MLRTKAFTLLELIIVIIIVGVLASLALPRFFRMIEESRATEAWVNIGAIRQAMERCYLMHNGTYVSCSGPLDIDDPDKAPNAHFTYQRALGPGPGDYTIYATRNSRDGGDGWSGIEFYVVGDSITYWGKGAFSNIKSLIYN